MRTVLTAPYCKKRIIACWEHYKPTGRNKHDPLMLLGVPKQRWARFLEADIFINQKFSGTTTGPCFD